MVFQSYDAHAQTFTDARKGPKNTGENDLSKLCYTCSNFYKCKEGTYQEREK
jgi:hypothetical protein